VTTNRLAESGSAYLLSAAHQPIHWYAWGDDAFAAAVVPAAARNEQILAHVGQAARKVKSAARALTDYGADLG